MEKGNLISFILLIIIVVVFIGTLIYVFTRPSPPTKTICFSNQICIQAELAQTQKEHEIGLMFRRSLQEDKGMLFIFPNRDFHSFWMKNTLIPLDVLWLDENFTIVDIKTAEPCKVGSCPSFVPKNKSLYVLEVNKGFAQKNNISVGDVVKMNN